MRNKTLNERLQSTDMIHELKSFFIDWVGEWNVYVYEDDGFINKISLEVNDNVKNIKFHLNTIKNIAHKYKYKVKEIKTVKYILDFELIGTKKYYGDEIIRIEINCNYEE